MELHCLLIILAMFSLDRSVVSANGLLWRQHVCHDHNTNRYNAHIHILVVLKKTSVTFATAYMCNCFESLKTLQLCPIYAFTILRVAQFSSLILLKYSITVKRYLYLITQHFVSGYCMFMAS